MNLTQEQRKLIIESVLQSDHNYLDKLLQRKVLLEIELHSVKGSILKKAAEIQVMQSQVEVFGYPIDERY